MHDEKKPEEPHTTTNAISKVDWGSHWVPKHGMNDRDTQQRTDARCQASNQSPNRTRDRQRQRSNALT